jgi:hypothetical protein
MTEAPETILYLSILKALTILLGLVIVYLGARAYRAQPRKPLLWLTVGIGVLTLGAISEGVAFQGLGWTLDQSHLFEAVVTLAGFGVLVYSLYSS